MAVIYTFHASASPNQGVAWGSGTLGKQSGNSVSVADGAVTMPELAPATRSAAD